MMDLSTLRECLAHNDWARDRIMAWAADLSAAALDQPFEMGEGSLRATLRHHYGAERNWAERVNMPGWQALRRATELSEIADLDRWAKELSGLRRQWLAGLAPADVERSVTYTLSTGRTLTDRLADILLHVWNHGVHHRAQAVHMLRRVGSPLPPPETDYIFMKLDPAQGDPPRVTVAVLRTQLDYSDWADGRVRDVAAALPEEQLDRRFDIGQGTIRGTLGHLLVAQEWWVANWTSAARVAFPPTERLAIAELDARWARVRAARSAFLDGLRDADLLGHVSVRGRSGDREFPLGVTLLQIGQHGTYHRAQLLNMFRHVGAAVPGLDVLIMLHAQEL